MGVFRGKTSRYAHSRTLSADQYGQNPANKPD